MGPTKDRVARKDYTPARKDRETMLTLSECYTGRAPVSQEEANVSDSDQEKPATAEEAARVVLGWQSGGLPTPKLGRRGVRVGGPVRRGLLGALGCSGLAVGHYLLFFASGSFSGSGRLRIGLPVRLMNWSCLAALPINSKCFRVTACSSSSSAASSGGSDRTSMLYP